MTTLEIKEIKHDLIRSIFNINDANVLGQVRDYLDKIQGNDSPEPPAKSVKEINHLIEVADNEEGVGYESFKKRYNLLSLTGEN